MRGHDEAVGVDACANRGLGAERAGRDTSRTAHDEAFVFDRRRVLGQRQAVGIEAMAMRLVECCRHDQARIADGVEDRGATEVQLAAEVGIDETVGDDQAAGRRRRAVAAEPAREAGEELGGPVAEASADDSGPVPQPPAEAATDQTEGEAPAKKKRRRRGGRGRKKAAEAGPGDGGSTPE